MMEFGFKGAMMRILKTVLATLMVIGVFSGGVIADDSSPEAVLKTLFDGMRNGDGASIRAVVASDARLDRIKKDGSMQQGHFERWIRWVDQQEVGDADEQVFGVKVLSESPELATVWAPFTINYKGKLVGCGINQFTMAKAKAGWRIVYGIDIHVEADCSTYRDQFE